MWGLRMWAVKKSRKVATGGVAGGRDQGRNSRTAPLLYQVTRITPTEHEPIHAFVYRT